MHTFAYAYTFAYACKQHQPMCTQGATTEIETETGTEPDEAAQLPETELEMEAAVPIIGHNSLTILLYITAIAGVDHAGVNYRCDLYV